MKVLPLLVSIQGPERSTIAERKCRTETQKERGGELVLAAAKKLRIQPAISRPSATHQPPINLPSATDVVELINQTREEDFLVLALDHDLGAHEHHKRELLLAVDAVGEEAIHDRDLRENRNA